MSKKHENTLKKIKYNYLWEEYSDGNLYLKDCRLQNLKSTIKKMKRDDHHIVSMHIHSVESEFQIIAELLAQELPSLSVEELHIVDSNVKTEDIRVLAPALVKCANLRLLNLSDNHIGSDGLQFLINELKKTNVTRLYLDSNGIKSKAIIACAETLPYTNLIELSLNDNNIGNKGGRALAEILPLTAISELDLGDNKMGAKAIKKLSEILPKTSLNKLFLNNCFREKSHSGQSNNDKLKLLIENLPNSEVTVLSIGWNKLDNSVVQSLLQVLKCSFFTDICLDGNNNISPELLNEVNAILAVNNSRDKNIKGEEAEIVIVGDIDQQ